MPNHYSVNLRGGAHTHQYWGNQRHEHDHAEQGRFLVAAKRAFSAAYGVALNDIHHSNLQRNNPHTPGTQVTRF